MKKISFLILILCLSTFCGSAANGLTNYPIPHQPKTLRILGIGNSFTDDGMTYLPNLLAAAGINNVVLGRLYIGGCSLQRHCKEYETNAPSYVYYKSTKNKWETISKKATMLYGLLDENWDIIVVQQVSGESGILSSYQPWLDQLLELVRYNCKNPGACIVWQQTWAYASNSNHPDYPKYSKNQIAMYQSIMSCNQKIIDSTPLEIVIPTGTAIQNLRNAFPIASEHTRDGYHLSYKMGRYTAACTWFQALVGPAFGISIEGNSCRLAGSANALTDEEAIVCQTAARRACARLYTVWVQ